MKSLTLLSMHVICKGKGNVLPISIILAALEINLDENSGVKQHKLYYMCSKRVKNGLHNELLSILVPCCYWYCLDFACLPMTLDAYYRYWLQGQICSSNLKGPDVSWTFSVSFWPFFVLPSIFPFLFQSNPMKISIW